MDEGHGGTLIRQKKFWFGEKIFARSTEAQTDVCNLRVQIDRGLSLEKHFSSSSSTLHICLFCFHNKAIFSISSVFKSHSNGRRKNKLWRILSIFELSIKVGSDAIRRERLRWWKKIWKCMKKAAGICNSDNFSSVGNIQTCSSIIGNVGVYKDWPACL